MDYAGHRKTGKEKKLEKKALKEKYRLEEKVYRSKGEKIFLGILLAFVFL